MLREEVAGLRQEINANRLLEHKSESPVITGADAENVAQGNRKWWAFWRGKR